VRLARVHHGRAPAAPAHARVITRARIRTDVPNFAGRVLRTIAHPGRLQSRTDEEQVMSDEHRVNALRAFERHGVRTRSQVVNARSSNFAFSTLVVEGFIVPVGPNGVGALEYRRVA
jgi:hypothetical protein